MFQVDLKHIDQEKGSNVVDVGIDLKEFYLSVEWDILAVPATRWLIWMKKNLGLWYFAWIKFPNTSSPNRVRQPISPINEQTYFGGVGWVRSG